MAAIDPQVAEWCRAAHALDAQAEALLRQLHPDVAVERGAVCESTRGPHQMRLRALAVKLKARPVVDLHGRANNLYWRMVAAWDLLQRRWASKVARQWRIDADDALQIIRLGWWRAAIRLDPSRGRLQSAAWSWAIQGVIMAPETQNGGIRIPSDGGSARRANVSHIDDRMPGTDNRTTADRLSAEPEDRESERDMKLLRAAVADLAPRQREVLHHRYYAGEDIPTLAEAGRTMGLTRERARQLEGLALGHLRKRLSDTTSRRANP